MRKVATVLMRLAGPHKHLKLNNIFSHFSYALFEFTLVLGFIQ